MILLYYQFVMICVSFVKDDSTQSTLTSDDGSQKEGFFMSCNLCGEFMFNLSITYAGTSLAGMDQDQDQHKQEQKL